jgi:DNA/RNA endonuclease G (NUC1)
MKKMLFLLAFLAGLLSCGKTQQDLSVSVNTEAASQITVSSATLTGSFSKAVGLVREVGFEWGESNTDLSHTQQADWNMGQTSFKATIDNLGDNKTYYYRAYVILYDKDNIKSFYGAVTSFQTLEQVQPTPTPEPSTEGNQPGWAELPVMKIKADGNYKVNADDPNQYYAWHICPDVNGPTGKARNYTVCFSAEDHVAYWVAAPRHPMYSKANTSRTDAYTWDPDVPKDIQYKREGANAGSSSGCNRGHLLGSAERRVSEATNKQVFYHTNIAPQLSTGFNTGGGGWNILESFVEGQECSDTLYVVIGCYFKDYKDAYGKEAKAKKITYAERDDVSQPTMFYYALLRTKAGNSGKSVKDVSTDDLKCAAFVRTHTNDHKGQAVTATEMMTVAELEKITGFSYFPNVPNAPKTSFKASDWGL